MSGLCICEMDLCQHQRAAIDYAIVRRCAMAMGLDEEMFWSLQRRRAAGRFDMAGDARVIWRLIMAEFDR